MNNLISTSEIISLSEYTTVVKDFYRPAWKSVLSQVLKLETRQTYIETGNLSYELMAKGEFKKSIDLIPSVRESDYNLYKDLKNRKVDFIRCRPVHLPLTSYLKWEIENYKFNSEHCERIFFLEENILLDIFNNIALHDFAVFDHDKAIILDYNNMGEFKGGWIVNDTAHILNLVQLFSIIRSYSIEFSIFLKKYSIE
ncbi:DUF6879 family protein [Siphonobacter sp. SORGH_AS_1065]|uniref:DUF6879 family protein n=1 Tax=Siphonobacter sp. SORGH_AS_1065 TaxID=3041795 RepID=UPI002780A265|nr:DUF6879 family protein [Siphonobacter sp. SORGH_AS_1065]MDQ1086180.1 hypothetical protein [Siphonobacter sp. SORGH_AS_1065]